jgi:hypothetical protein
LFFSPACWLAGDIDYHLPGDRFVLGSHGAIKEREQTHHADSSVLFLVSSAVFPDDAQSTPSVASMAQFPISPK